MTLATCTCTSKMLNHPGASRGLGWLNGWGKRSDDTLATRVWCCKDDLTSERAWRSGVCRNRCLSPHSSCGRENKWSKRWVLHLAYPLFINSFFLLLMLSVAGRRRLVLVRGGSWSAMTSYSYSLFCVQGCETWGRRWLVGRTAVLSLHSWILIPKPPCRAGKAKRARSWS